MNTWRLWRKHRRTNNLEKRFYLFRDPNKCWVSRYGIYGWCLQTDWDFAFLLPNNSTHTLWWTNIAMENHHFSWENPLFLWPFSIAMLVHQRVTKTCSKIWKKNTPGGSNPQPIIPGVFPKATRMRRKSNDHRKSVKPSTFGKWKSRRHGHYGY